MRHTVLKLHSFKSKLEDERDLSLVENIKKRLEDEYAKSLFRNEQMLANIASKHENEQRVSFA